MLSPELETLINPEEQSLITEMRADIDAFRYGRHPAYRSDLPAHNYDHIYGEVLPEVLRLLDRVPDINSPRNRLLAIAAVPLHDVVCTVPLDTQEGFATAEQRTAILVEPLLRAYLNPADTEEGQGLIIATSPDAACETLMERIVRRGDISNIGKGSSKFLARTLDFFHEEFILWQDGVGPRPQWQPYLDTKARILRRLIEPDLSLPSEPRKRQLDGRQLGCFTIATERNIRMLETKVSVRNPSRLESSYGQYLRPLVRDFDKVMMYVKGQADA